MTVSNGVVVTKAGYAAFLGFAAGATLEYTYVAFGDAGGTPYAPNDNQTSLVHEVYRAPITAKYADNQGVLWFETLIPEDHADALARPSHGWNVHEAGVYGTINGAAVLLAVARLGGGYKARPETGRAEAAFIKLGIAGAPPGAVALTVSASTINTLDLMARTPWITVDGVILTAPDAPAAGATYLVGAVPIGTFTGHAHEIAQWSGTIWAFAGCPEGHVISDRSKAVGAADRYLRRTSSDWTTAAAATDAYGPTRLATEAEVLAATAGLAVSPDQLTAWGNQWAGTRTFPATAHTHPISQVTNLQAALDGKVAKAGDTMTGALVAPTVTVTGTLTGNTVMQGDKQALDRATELRSATASYLKNGSVEGGGLAVDTEALFGAGRDICRGAFSGPSVQVRGGNIVSTVNGTSRRLAVTFHEAQPDANYGLFGFAVGQDPSGPTYHAVSLPTFISKSATGCVVDFSGPDFSQPNCGGTFTIYR